MRYKLKNFLYGKALNEPPHERVVQPNYENIRRDNVRQAVSKKVHGREGNSLD